jgi:hypothetical protein
LRGTRRPAYASSLPLGVNLAAADSGG